MRHDPALVAQLTHAALCDCRRCSLTRDIRETKVDLLRGAVLGAIASVVIVVIHFWPTIAAALQKGLLDG